MKERTNKPDPVSVFFDPHGGKKDLMWRRLEARSSEKESGEALVSHLSEQEVEL